MTAERTVHPPVQSTEVADVIGTAERGRMTVIDLPSVLSLFAVVRTVDFVSEVVVPPVLGQSPGDRTASRPSGDLLLFRLRELS
jgi:hypothetical protein